MRKLLFAAVIFSGFIVCSCKKNEVRHTVQYFISGKSIMTVSYTDAKGELLFVNNVSAAWKHAFNAPGDGRFVKLIVTSIDGGAVGGCILLDGQEAALNSSNTGSVTMTTRLP